MPELLINCVTGEQKIIDIDETGSYFDEARVLWDTRKDGRIPQNIVLGKMERQGNSLVELPEFTSDHAIWAAAVQAEEDIKAKKASLEEDVKGDSDFNQLRQMGGKEIDDWFSANVTTNAQATKVLKKLIKIMIRKEII